ncbi:YceD family protein [Pseudoroseicyclus sp. H15]
MQRRGPRKERALAFLAKHIEQLTGPAAGRKPRDIVLAPEADELKALADGLGILGVRKLRFEGVLSPTGAQDWQLTGKLGATVVQECVATLKPVTTRLDEDVARRFMADLPPPPPGEVEMPQDETIEPLDNRIDVAEIVEEALALALPPWPRADDAPPVEVHSGDGEDPGEEKRENPFAALKGLRDQMDGDS